MTVIHIYGASGSGTSTLAGAISSAYGFKHLDTDDYFWMPTDPPFITKRPVSDRLEMIKKDISQAHTAVISGSLCGWGDCLIPLFDLVIRLEVPKEIRLARIKEREYRRFGNRICAGGDMYEEHLKFISWAAEYDCGDVSMRSKAMHDNWAGLVSGSHIVLDGTRPLDRLLDELHQYCVL